MTKLGLFLIVAVCSQVESYSERRSDGINMILYRAVQRVRDKFISSFTFPDPPTLDVRDENINLHIKLKNTTVSNTNFTIDYVRSHLVSLWAKYRVTTPSAEISGTYKIDGEAFGKNIQGSGYFRTTITNLAHSGFVQMRIIKESFVMDFLRLDFHSDSVKNEITGLNVDGVGGDVAEAFLANKLWPWLTTEKETICHNVAELVKDVGNKVIQSKSLIEIVHMLKLFGRRF